PTRSSRAWWRSRTTPSRPDPVGRACLALGAVGGRGRLSGRRPERDAGRRGDLPLLRPLQRSYARGGRRARRISGRAAAVSRGGGRDGLAAPAHRLGAGRRLPSALEGVRGPAAVPLPGAASGRVRALGDL